MDTQTIIAIVVGFIVIAIIFIGATKLSVLSDGAQKGLRARYAELNDKLNAIVSRFNPESEESMLAVNNILIQIDNYMKNVLTYIGVKGNTLGEQLKALRFKNLFTRGEINALWECHKLRNRMVHDEYRMNKNDVYKLVKCMQVLYKAL